MSLTIRPPPVSLLGISLESLSGKQLEALEKMRKEFGSTEFRERGNSNSTFALDDYNYLKYLRARDFDFDKAKQVLHKTIEWRNKIVPAAITESTPGIRIEADIMGRSREGHPIVFLEMNNFHASDYTLDTYVASRVYELEEVFRMMAREGWKVDRYVLMCDAKEFRFLRHATPHAIRLFHAFSEILQSLYRDSIHCIILINVMSAFQKLLAMMKPWMKPSTASRIVVIKDNSEIQKYIDPSNIYQHLGGTKSRERFYTADEEA